MIAFNAHHTSYHTAPILDNILCVVLDEPIKNNKTHTFHVFVGAKNEYFACVIKC